ncbi:MAG: WD40 repeat domain-containing protein [Chloroflexota bacterium]
MTPLRRIENLTRLQWTHGRMRLPGAAPGSARRFRLVCSLALLGLLALLTAGCAAPRRLPGGPPPGVLPPTATPTATPRGAPTLTPTPTRAPSATPSPTAPPTQTFTPTPTLLYLAETPLPLGAPAISLENAGRVSGLAEWYEPDVAQLVWTPLEHTLAVATSKQIHWYNVPARKTVRTLYPALADVIDLDFDVLDTWLVVGTRHGNDETGFASGLELWMGPGWQPMGVLYGDARPLTALAFSPDRDYLAVAYSGPRGENSGVDLWLPYSWTISTTLVTGQALDVAFSPDAGLLAVSPDRYSLRVYDLADRKWLYCMPTSFTGAINAMAFSSDGFTLATGHYDGMLRLWDMRSGDLLLEFPTGAVVQSLAFSPDGRVIVTGGSYQHTLVQLWSAGSGELLRALYGHLKGVTRLAFAPDSMYIVSASYDGMLRAWGIPLGP